jgi:protoporphyrinogen oxidase
LAGGLRVGGVAVDLGSHRLHPAMAPQVHRELVGLLGPDLQVRRRHGRARLYDRWIDFPLRPGDLARQLPVSATARVGVDLLAAPLRSRRAQREVAPRTFMDVALARVGPTVARGFYAPYAAKVWGVPADELAAEVAVRRVGTSTPGALLARVLRGREAKGRTFLYPRLGFAEVTAALAAAAAEAGARLVCGAEVDRVTVGGGEPGTGRTVRVSCRDGRAVRAATVFSTLPAATLCGLLEPPAPTAVRTAARSLESRAMVLVYLVVDRDRYTPYDAHYLPGPTTPITRLSEPKNYRDGPDPPDRTVLCAELPAWVDDELWSRDDADLARLATDTLLDLDLPAARPIAHAVERRPAVYPVLRVGGEEAWHTVERHLGDLAARDGIVSFGRQGLHAHDNTHHALAMAWEAAACLDATGRFDTARWSAALERFARHVVED